MNYLDDPQVISAEPDFIAARQRLAEQIRCDLPLRADGQLYDETDAAMFAIDKPEFIIPMLCTTRQAEVAGILDIQLSVTLSEEHAIEIETESGSLIVHSTSLNLGPEWTEALMQTLDIRETIAVYRFAYSRRYKKLSAMIERAKNWEQQINLNDRRESLEENCTKVIDAFRTLFS